MDIQKGIEFTVMELVELKEAPYNPRTIKDEAYQGLGGAIEEFGFMVPIVWNKRTGHVVGGHQRLRYLREAGETESLVAVVDIDIQEEMALNIALNNPEIRGKYSSDVIGALKYAEGQSKEVFKNSGLDKLKKRLAFFNKKPPDSQKPSGPKTHKAVVTCPKCKGRWGMKDKKVINDSVEV